MIAQSLLYLTWMASLVASQSIDPNSIPIATRDQWCSQQQTSCPLICLQLPGGSSSTQKNTCDANSLDFSCVCNNGASPNSTQYTQTIPYFICTAYNSQCQVNCNGNSTCQADCVQLHPCGAQDPVRPNVTSTTTAGASSTTTTGSGNVIYTGFGTDSASTATGSSAASPGVMSPLLTEFGQAYGLFMVAAGLVGGFAIVL